MTMSPPRIRAEMSGISEAPGKVWFWELAAAVIDADRCVQCGACVAACPTDSIGLGSDDLPKLVKMCTGCSLCWDFCPRGGLRYESTWMPAETPASPFGAAAATAGASAATAGGRADAATTPVDDWRITGADPAPGLGRVVETIGARVSPTSRLTALHAQDGGVVTAILLASLAAGEIDGAVVAREDPDQPWKGVPYLATTSAEIRAASGSFYNQTMALSRLDLAAAGLAPDARIAVVGTPCEIQGIRALQAREWRRGSSRVDAVALTIALLCTKSFDYRKLMVGELSEKRGLSLGDIGKVDVIHGRMIVEDRTGSTLVDEPVKDFHGAALKGCDECADFLGRGADLSIGSVGSAPGYSSVIVRTEAGARAFAAVRDEFELSELESPEALERLDRLDKKIASKSLQRPFDPEGPLFIDFAEHVTFYAGTDRAPVWRQ
ncbi:MAG TPA: Coenzyme F420 hydrogenase/dehydrogenase, beta subunit C-terminal domain [Acidimicrobiales bacterium]|nr:Coenzyme F420 hydrogenase/dehydrogenase, beta subunit C-terminal domain [Acidimicrobiales bacterium]